MDPALLPALHIGLFGGPLDTGNLGVSALGISVVRGVQSLRPDARVTLFDHGLGVRHETIEAGEWGTAIELEGSSYSRRFYRSSNQQQAYLASRLGLGAYHPFLRRLSALDAVLDISGGDSFSDLYGGWRFRVATMPKRLALATSTLLLLPQTYGPFRDPARRALAADLMARSQQLWARDARSLDVVRDMLGPRFDPDRHRAGVDVAFGLPSRAPQNVRIRADIEAAVDGGSPVFGLNVSGLLYHARDEGRSAFGLQSSYRDLVLEIARSLLTRHDCRLLLIPHVAPPCWTHEDDRTAALDLFERLPVDLRTRVFAVPHLENPMEVKWVVGRCHWFCGTRMHSCVAGLSQAVPTTTLAYSDKSLGVFETVDAGDWVFDPRTDSAAAVLEGILATVSQRDEMSYRLRNALRRVEAIWLEQFRCIVDGIRSARELALRERQATMFRRIRDVRDVSELQMCTGCGACAYLRPEQIRMRDVETVGLRPETNDTPEGRRAAVEALAVCPGHALSHDTRNFPPGAIASLRDGWGPILELWEGYASDGEIRHAASSGGAATALALACMEQLGFAGTLHIRARSEAPDRNETVLSTQRSELLAATGSRYAPASPCDGLRLVEKAAAPCVFIGKPCDVAAASKARVLLPSLDEKLGLTIGIFCAGTPSTLATRAMMRRMGVLPSDHVKSVRYRGHGWPGLAQVEVERDGTRRKFTETYEESWGFLQEFRQWRCYVCADHTGEFADIAVGDPWYRAIPADEPGRSLILIRSARGKKIFDAAVAAGYLTVERASPDKLERSQPELLRGRGAILGRIWTTRLMGAAAPSYSGFPMARFFRSELTFQQKAQTFYGTAKRVFTKRLLRRRRLGPAATE